MTECAGLWRRTLLIDTDGSRNDTADVRWLQGITAFVDLRRPRPLLDLSEQDGFAGWLSQSGDVFTWDRFAGIQPQDTPDEGRMHWDGDVLVEDGVHSDYAEHWVRDPAPAEPSWALGLSTADGDAALLLRVGGLFGWAERVGSDVEIALGTVTDSAWLITDSSLPHRAGTSLAPRRDGGELKVAGAVGNRWQITESEGSVTL
ncbi:MAG: hypothetical protein ABWY93_01230 [Mycobacterium sp.]